MIRFSKIFFYITVAVLLVWLVALVLCFSHTEACQNSFYYV